MGCALATGSGLTTSARGGQGMSGLRHDRPARCVGIWPCPAGGVESRAGVLGLAYSFQADELREAPALSVLSALVQASVQVRGFDPAEVDNARTLLPAALESLFSKLEAPVGAEYKVVLTERDDCPARSDQSPRDGMCAQCDRPAQCMGPRTLRLSREAIDLDRPALNGPARPCSASWTRACPREAGTT